MKSKAYSFDKKDFIYVDYGRYIMLCLVMVMVVVIGIPLFPVVFYSYPIYAAITLAVCIILLLLLLAINWLSITAVRSDGLYHTLYGLVPWEAIQVYDLKSTSSYRFPERGFGFRINSEILAQKTYPKSRLAEVLPNVLKGIVSIKLHMPLAFAPTKRKQFARAYETVIKHHYSGGGYYFSDEMGDAPIAKFHSSFFPGLFVTAISVYALYLFLGLLDNLEKTQALNDDFRSLMAWLAENLGLPNDFYYSVEAFVIVSILLTLLLIRICPVKLYKDGIHSYSYTDFNQGINWDRIHRVDSNLLYIQLRDENDRICVIIPNKWVYNFDDLKRLVIQHAGRDNPLAKYFLDT